MLAQAKDSEEKEFLKLIENEQDKTRKPINIVDIKKKIHLKQLAKKTKVDRIFGASTSIVTLIVLAISAVLLYKLCLKKYRKQQISVNHFGRINERLILQEEPISMKQCMGEGIPSKQAKNETSNETNANEATGAQGTSINLREIIKSVSN